MQTRERELRNPNALLILGLAIITSALTGPGQTVGVAVFNDHLVDGLDLSRQAVTYAYLVGTLSSAMLLPFVGKFIDRRGVRLSQMLVGVVFTLALLNMSQVNGWVWLAVGFFGIRFAGQGSLSLVASVDGFTALHARSGYGSRDIQHAVKRSDVDRAADVGRGDRQGWLAQSMGCGGARSRCDGGTDCLLRAAFNAQDIGPSGTVIGR